MFSRRTVCELIFILFLLLLVDDDRKYILGIGAAPNREVSDLSYD